jgi:MFS family permease
MYRYSAEEIQINKRYSIRNGMYAAISNNIYSGFLALFAIEALKASEYQVALLSSIPQMMNLLVMIPAAILINRLAEKKAFTAVSIAIARFFLLVIALIPFIPLVNHAWLLVITVGFLWLPNALAGLSWQSFIGDLIPQDQRNQFFAKRNRANTFAAMISTLSVGIVLNLFDKTNTLPYQIFFFLAFLMGMMEVYYLTRHIEYRQEKEVVKTEKKLGFVQEFLREKPYILFLGSAVVFNFGWQMAWPLFNIYQIQYAHATALWVSLFTVANMISQMISYPYWGKFAEKYGNSVMLFVSSVGMATAPFLTVLTTNLYYLVIINLFTGIFVAGIAMLLFNQLLDVSPEGNRTSYIAGYNVTIGLVGFIAPQVGVWLLESLNIYLAMHISSVIRFLGALSFLAVVLFFENRRTRVSAR